MYVFVFTNIPFSSFLHPVSLLHKSRTASAERSQPMPNKSSKRRHKLETAWYWPRLKHPTFVVSNTKQGPPKPTRSGWKSLVIPSWPPNYYFRGWKSLVIPNKQPWCFIGWGLGCANYLTNYGVSGPFSRDAPPVRIGTKHRDETIALGDFLEPVFREGDTERPLTPWKFNIAPEKWWLEDKPFLLGRYLFRGYVKLREGTWLLWFGVDVFIVGLWFVCLVFQEIYPLNGPLNLSII